MLSLKTVLLWVAVAALGLFGIVLPIVMTQSGIPVNLVVALWIGIIAALIVTAISITQSIREDRAALPLYENKTWNRLKPLVLLASGVFFGIVATRAAIGIAGSPAETCTYSGVAENCELNLSLAAVLISTVFIAVFVVTPALIAISSAAALVRDALHHRQVGA